MKNHLIYLLFVCAVAQLQAQTDNWFVSGAQWAYDYNAADTFGIDYFEFAGKTIFQGQMCAKLHWYSTENDWLNDKFIKTDLPDQYMFARNDSVFYWHNNHFSLLYDFTRAPGDTLRGVDALPGQIIVVTDTGSISVQGVSLRFQKLKWQKPNFTFWYTGTVYERQGGEHLIYPYGNNPQDRSYHALCYRDSQITGPDMCTLYNQAPKSYVPFTQNLAIWLESASVWLSSTSHQLKMEGDTVIPGIAAGKKLYFRLISSGSAVNPWRLIGLISQDSAAQKVYFTRLTDDLTDLINGSDNLPALNETGLLYDFNLLPHQVLPWKPKPNIFLKTDSIQISDGTWRRRYFFGDDDFNLVQNYYWIEGIGGNMGLFSSFMSAYVFDFSQTLDCYGENGVSIYSTWPQICDNLVPVSAAETRAAVQFYPNPNNGAVFLELPEGIPAVDVDVFDLYGRLLAHRAFVQDGNKVEMPGKGLFFLGVRLPDGRQLTRRAVSE